MGQQCRSPPQPQQASRELFLTAGWQPRMGSGQAAVSVFFSMPEVYLIFLMLPGFFIFCQNKRSRQQMGSGVCAPSWCDLVRRC